ncbi:MAG: TetR/AcrR family transcriptional regulator C-terminal domain-containing protein [Oscillospiraceae bacterium]|nr:TetR/AcrR family transcriptional regulator C-terminal domain-containing protein [Oscillospiraceae bacterium]
MKSNFTKQCIAQALMELLEEKSIEKITVTEIVEKCGVNRQTFYYHFADIYALLEWSFSKTLTELPECHSLAEDDWEGTLRALLQWLNEHRSTVLHGYSAADRAYYVRILQKVTSPKVMAWLEESPLAPQVPDEKKQFVCRTFSHVIINYIVEWIEEGMPEHSDTLDDCITLFAEFREYALGCFAEER